MHLNMAILTLRLHGAAPFVLSCFPIRFQFHAVVFRFRHFFVSGFSRDPRTEHFPPVTSRTCIL